MDVSCEQDTLNIDNTPPVSLIYDTDQGLSLLNQGRDETPFSS